MPHIQIDISHDFPQQVSTVYAAMKDHSQHAVVLRVPVKRIQEGTDEPDGIGSVRQLGWLVPLFGFEETVTAMEPDQRIDYQISRGGFPVSNHRGHMLFSGNDAGSRFHWHIGLDAPPLIASLLKTILTRTITSGLHRMQKKL